MVGRWRKRAEGGLLQVSETETAGILTVHRDQIREDSRWDRPRQAIYRGCK
ncbi:hypothetical protein [Faecalibaculum rodentium]|jgi:hypothetical protein|uniref:Uncharacterized protein n=1 Tax=Faecalibaculum rodentium TaxID=1702221 RepID=A0A140DWF8_9FIRM|nr:hypothetical protein [Faecalibaculum rodentium]AMK54985.1 hypothetical protein AALO17_18510 [Faecalibaculum rodentium]